MTSEFEIDHTKQDVDHLSHLAMHLKSIVDGMTKPLIIELSGTPRSGKTTSCNAISKFFRVNSIPAHIISERAAESPIHDKQHLFFNIWTGVTGLAELLEALDNEKGVVLQDRGLFDTLVWMNLLESKNVISPTDLKTIEGFFLLDKWVKQIDIVVAVLVNPQTALQREHQVQILDIPGTIMNFELLEKYNLSLAQSIVKYNQFFPKIISVDTSHLDAIEGVKTIADKVLHALNGLITD